MFLHTASANVEYRHRMPSRCLLAVLIVVVATSATASPPFKSRTDDQPMLVVQLESPPADVLKAVQEVMQDQIIHGTFSYEKERILYGAHSADSAKAFGAWKGDGKAYYKVADGILSPRYFKNSEDVGTISVRYVVQEAGPDSTILKLDAIFVDARSTRHRSEGNVESAEYAAIQSHLKSIQAKRQKPPDEPAQTSAQPPQTAVLAAAAPPSSPAARVPHPEPVGEPEVPALTVAQLQEKVQALRQQVELRVKESGAQLKSAPFESSATIVALQPQTAVLIVVLTPYWYGVETEDGHHGWVHHSQLEPLP